MKKLPPRTTLGLLALGASLLAYLPPALAQFIPGAASSVGSTNVVPDVPIWYDSIASRVRVGPILPLTNQIADNNNWEPWVSVVGEKVFVVEANKWADDGSASLERYILSFQPAAPGSWADAKLGESFYDDNGKRYTNGISSRQDGNPGRVYGDRRYNGVNVATSAEADPEDYPTFFGGATLDGRFTNAVYFDVAGQRCALAQCFSLDFNTLTQTPLCKAFAGNTFGHPEFLPVSGNVTDVQWGRQGGGLAALDNGNFAFLYNERSLFWPDSGNTTAGQNQAVACVFSPTGGVVKASFLVSTNTGDLQAWSEPCGFKGGFCIRYGLNTDALLSFYDNSGNRVATNLHNAASGVALDGGRGDGTKIAGDIRTPWVYYASGGWLTVWNGTNGAFMTKYHVVDDLDPTATVDRSDVGCDSLGNVCVAWNGKPLPAATLVGTNMDQSFANDQVMARLLRFDGTNVTPLTHTFFAFLNHDGDTNFIQGFQTTNPNVDMTTKYICIAGKGLINSTNNVSAGPDSAAQTTVYTVIRNPGFVPPTLTATLSGNSVVISWPASGGDGTLQSTPALKPTAWAALSPQPPTQLVNGNTFTKTVPIGAANAFFRLADP